MCVDVARVVCLRMCCVCLYAGVCVCESLIGTLYWLAPEVVMVTMSYKPYGTEVCARLDVCMCVLCVCMCVCVRACAYVRVRA